MDETGPAKMAPLGRMPGGMRRKALELAPVPEEPERPAVKLLQPRHDVSIGLRGMLAFTAGLRGKMDLIDSCKTSGADVVTGWCGVKT